MITRRGLLGAAAGAAGAAALAGCSNGGSSGGGGGSAPVGLRPDGMPDLTWKGTISTGVQGYTPAVEGVKLAPGSAQLQEFGKAAAEFTRLYPDITIEFLGSDYTYEVDQMKTAATGGQLPDIWWQQAPIVKTSFPAGVATDLTEYMERPNPFVEGNARWRDVYNQSVYATTSADPETIYTNNGDFVGTAFFYNAALFAEAGVEPPQDYRGLIEVCRALAAKGITPCAIQPITSGFGWVSRIFMANFLGEEKLQQIDAYSEEPGISSIDVAVAYRKGLLDPRQNPAVLAWWPVAKELFDHCDDTIMQLPPDPPVGSPEPGTLFAAQEVAMIYDGTWAPGAVRDAGSDFEVGSFPWPSLAGSYEHATDFDSSNAVSGPNAAWQFHISTARSDSSLQEEGKLDAVVSWMQFFSTPQWNESICNERGAFLPTFTGAEPPASMTDLAELAAKPIYAISGGTELSTEAADQVSRLFQQYLLGQVTTDEVATRYPEIIDKGLEEFLRTTPVDFEAYAG
ncbi:ABC transporter substrate-binding protein [Auraticoccus monumenti]|uniref:Extracellular solute-binding protein n=1 Tax=Auraticoccus monumenti TaxID=675864 RepID=A0A1G7E419_9ACTN|nr:extracellular solute-binding protein [Auraticoccus monumenti]SDE58359.1 extracellular solute-binding protein [Auraticoccus monumenti]